MIMIDEEIQTKELLTKEEKELVVKIMSSIQLQGSIQTLPEQIQQILTIIRKLS